MVNPNGHRRVVLTGFWKGVTDRWEKWGREPCLRQKSMDPAETGSVVLFPVGTESPDPEICNPGNGLREK